MKCSVWQWLRWICQLPNADLLILVCQMGPTLEVVSHDAALIVPKVVLGATFGGEVGEIARILGDLKVHCDRLSWLA